MPTEVLRCQAKKRGLMKILKMTAEEPAADELKRYLLPATTDPYSSQYPFPI